MPIYGYQCQRCGEKKEAYAATHDKPAPVCCGQAMSRDYSGTSIQFKWSPPSWVYRMDEIHKAQEQRGERLRMIYPREVGAT